MIDLHHNKIVHTFRTDRYPSQIAVTKNMRYAVTSNYKSKPATLTVLDLKRKQVVRNIPIEPYETPSGVHFVDNEQLLVNCEINSKILIVNLTTFGIIKVIDVHPIKPSHMVVNSLGTLAFVTDRHRGEIATVDLRNSKVMKNIQASRNGSEGICISVDEREMWSMNYKENEASVIDIGQLGVVDRVVTGRDPVRCKFAIPRFVLVSNALDASLTVYNSINHQKIKTIQFSKCFFFIHLTFCRRKKSISIRYLAT